MEAVATFKNKDRKVMPIAVKPLFAGASFAASLDPIPTVELTGISPDDGAREGAVSNLRSACELLGKGDFFWAAEYLYLWLKQSETLERNCVLRIADRVFPKAPGNPGEWLLLLLKRPMKIQALEWIRMNSSHPLVHLACSLAMARHYAFRNELQNAKNTLEAAKKKVSHHKIDNALFAVEQKMKGYPVPPYLNRYLGDDDGYFKKRTCPMPFGRFDIDHEGGVMVCCGYYMPDTKVGNLYQSTGVEVINSPKARDVRSSVMDGSFKHCDELKCPFISGEQLPWKSEVKDVVMRKAIETGDCSAPNPNHVVFGFDRTCNLSCPSCRTEMISDNQEIRDRKTKITEESILPLLKNSGRLDINLAGELFASKASRALLNKLNRAEYPNLWLFIISNGTLFTPEEWDKFPNIHDMVHTVRVSTDAARPETFEKLRRGGKWDRFSPNMEFIAFLRRSKKIQRFHVSFTYQVANFREMPDFVAYAKQLGCDEVIFEKLENPGNVFSEGEYIQKAVHRPEHPLHQDFLGVIRNPAMRDPMIVEDYRRLL